jgi:N-methylhydantoinase B
MTPIRLFNADGEIRETLDFVLANLRGRVEREGDIFAQRASTEVAARRLVEMFHQFGAPTVLACVERMMDESDLLMRAALREVPDGVYEGEDFLDDDGLSDRPIRIAVRITVDGDRATFDFGDSAPQAPGPINTPYFIACASVYYTCKALLGPTIPPNDGCYRALTVTVPVGRVLNPRPDAPVVGGNHETSQRIVDALFRALAPTLPERAIGAGVGGAAVTIIAGHCADGAPFTFYEVHGGGEGAAAHRDGLSGLRSNMGNTMNTPVEVIEHEHPIFVERHELVAGSGGAGRHRGGLGVRRAYRILTPNARLTTMIERCRVAPWGLFGAEPGRTARIRLERDGAVREVRGKETLELHRDDLVIVDTAGGGGYGPPPSAPPSRSSRTGARATSSNGAGKRDVQNPEAPRTDMENGRGTVICLVVATRCRTRCESWRGAGRSGSSARCLPASTVSTGAGERSGNSSRASSIASVHTTAPFGSAVFDQTLSLAHHGGAHQLGARQSNSRAKLRPTVARPDQLVTS